ncbi:hypothetical protein N656DRAFT_18411 [Canariomyces notabilis]|uniref:Secreted protein n=1 Tax=Canariomyces notabilis TaxID=2074819 RepID=A0AAN6YY90_9PEZI|nr:hypothetical protein N656DRAFT_18411 [Canariomyces arenarius]
MAHIVLVLPLFPPCQQTTEAASVLYRTVLAYIYIHNLHGGFLLLCSVYRTLHHRGYSWSQNTAPVVPEANRAEFMRQAFVHLALRHLACICCR